MKLSRKQEEEIVQKWIENNGCASFDLKNKQIIFHDGGGFSVEKKIKYRSRFRFKPITEGRFKGGSELVDIKGPKVRYEIYDCYVHFIELDKTINRLRRMKKMLNGLGYRTNYENRKEINR